MGLYLIILLIRNSICFNAHSDFVGNLNFYNYLQNRMLKYVLLIFCFHHYFLYYENIFTRLCLGFHIISKLVRVNFVRPKILPISDLYCNSFFLGIIEKILINDMRLTVGKPVSSTPHLNKLTIFLHHSQQDHQVDYFAVLVLYLAVN